MNEPWDNLEDELSRMKPRGLSPETREQIRRAIEEQPGPGLADSASLERPARFWRLALPALAAGLTLLAGTGLLLRALRPDRAPAVPPVAAQPPASLPDEAPGAPPPVADDLALQPVSMDTVLVGQFDDGACVDTAQRPFRKIRYSLVDNMQWKDPAKGVILTRSAPREKVVWVSLETY